MGILFAAVVILFVVFGGGSFGTSVSFSGDWYLGYVLGFVLLLVGAELSNRFRRS